MRRIFGMGREKIETLSVDDLEKRLSELRNEKIISYQSTFRTTISEIIGCRDEVLGALEELTVSKPVSEIYPGLLKAGESGRKLLIDKIRRALSELKAPQDISADSLRDFEQRLVKSVNLTTDAMVAHGRYVGAVFEREFARLRLRIDRMQYLLRQMHELGSRLLSEVDRIDSLRLKINSVISLRSAISERRKKLAELEASVPLLDSGIADEGKKLEELRKSEEYVAEAGIKAEAGAVENELRRFRNEVSAAFSEIARPLRKAWKLVDSGTHPMDGDRIKVLRVCMDNPLDLFSDGSLVNAAKELLTDIARLIEERKIELEETDRKKKLDKVRKLAVSLGDMKSRFDGLASRSGSYSGLEHPAEKAERSIEQNIRELMEKKEKTVREIEALRESIRKAEGEYAKSIQELASESAFLFEKAIKITS
ncbi:MAG: hypothetical protein QXG10_04500 [Candidatus Hadarchaeales archaeon]